MPTSNPKFSLQKSGQPETQAGDKARLRTEKKITFTDRKPSRLNIQNRIKVQERIKAPVESGGRVLLERVSTDPYGLSYACLLIPRFSSHYLMGDVEESLRVWMTKICLSFTWRLDHITVQPEYIEWILSVPPATSPSRCIRTIGEFTSKQIFDEFPHFRRENLSKDFWAPGFLVIGGSSPLPQELINAHIRMTRQQQGILPPSGD